MFNLVRLGIQEGREHVGTVKLLIAVSPDLDNAASAHRDLPDAEFGYMPHPTPRYACPTHGVPFEREAACSRARSSPSQ
jgi:hypothetical protein